MSADPTESLLRGQTLLGFKRPHASASAKPRPKLARAAGAPGAAAPSAPAPLPTELAAALGATAALYQQLLQEEKTLDALVSESRQALEDQVGGGGGGGGPPPGPQQQ